MLTAILARIKGYAAAAIGAALFLTFAYIRARQDGRKAAEAARAKKQADAIKQKRDVDYEVDKMDANHRRDNLSKWMRKDGG